MGLGGVGGWCGTPGPPPFPGGAELLKRALLGPNATMVVTRGSNAGNSHSSLSQLS